MMQKRNDAKHATPCMGNGRAKAQRSKRELTVHGMEAERSFLSSVYQDTLPSLTRKGCARQKQLLQASASLAQEPLTCDRLPAKSGLSEHSMRGGFPNQVRPERVQALQEVQI